MPLVERLVVADGQARRRRQHLWRGGHDPAMVKSALEMQLEEVPAPSSDERRVRLTLTNVRAAHYVPTGTSPSVCVCSMPTGPSSRKKKR